VILVYVLFFFCIFLKLFITYNGTPYDHSPIPEVSSHFPIPEVSSHFPIPVNYIHSHTSWNFLFTLVLIIANGASHSITNQYRMHACI